MAEVSPDHAVSDSPSSMTVEGIRQWHKDGGMSKYGWTKEFSEDLNDDKTPELFLAVVGFSRGADYAIFTKVSGTWKAIGGTSFGNLGIRVLPAKNQGWHDFIATCPSGRGGIDVTTYSWDGKTYVETKSEEIPMKWEGNEYVPRDAKDRNKLGPQTDTKGEPAGADQPATKPAAKPSVKDQPSTPTPKGGPR